MNPPRRLVRLFALFLALSAVLLVACSGEAAPDAPAIEPGPPSRRLLPPLNPIAHEESDPIVTRVADRSSVRQEAPIDPDVPATGTGAVTIDNRIRDEEWATAGTYGFDNQPLVRSVRYLFDSTNLYLRIDFEREVLGDEAAAFDLYIEGNGLNGDPATVLGTPLGLAADALVSWRGTMPVEAIFRTSTPATGWRLDGAPLATGFDGWSVEVAVPLVLVVGRLGSPTRLLFRVLDRTAGLEQAMVPAAGPGYLQLPEPAWGRQTS